MADEKDREYLDFTKVISERGRRSAEEGTRLLVAVAIASLGVFFVALTKEIKPILSGVEKYSAFAAVLAMGLASGCGLLSWLADSKVHITWALARTSKEDKAKRKNFYKQKEKWRRREKRIKWVFFICFFVGLLAGTGFILLRIIGTTPERVVFWGNTA